MLTFREKSLAIQIAAILLVFGYLGVHFWDQTLTNVQIVSVLLGSTVAMIIITSIAHIAVAIHHRPEATDERDRVVALRGSRNGYIILAVTTWSALLLIVGQMPAGNLFAIIMGGFALAELVRLGSQLIYYRRHA
jgi:hypothetical protein